MADVERLPIQHPQKPHCPGCKRDLHGFRTLKAEVAPYELEGLTLHGMTIELDLTCDCGQPLVLRKKTP